MGITLGMNMSLRNKTPLDDRQLFTHLSDMISFPETSLPDGLLTFCEGKTYQYNSSNEIDETTGKWREFKGSGGNGVVGADGKSAYEIWLDEGNTGTVTDFFTSLKGKDGAIGADGADGKSAYEIWLDEGNVGTLTDFITSLKGAIGADGADGKSAYEIWIEQGNVGTLTDFITSLKGAIGNDGTIGVDGKSAYEIWIEQGNVGTLTDFITSLKGEKGNDGTIGVDGKSAYDIWISAGNTGTTTDFLNSLKGTGTDYKNYEQYFASKKSEHTHDNLSILKDITPSDISNWNREESGKVKLNSTNDLSYLNDLLDNATFEIGENVIKVKSINGMNTTVTELNFIHGLDKNIMDYIAVMGTAMKPPKSALANDAALTAIPDPSAGDTYIVLDSEQKDGKTAIYCYTTDSGWVCIGITELVIRNFTTDPIDLTSEVTGTLPKEKIEGYHAHTNKSDVLDLLSVSNNKLCFNGTLVNDGDDYKVWTGTKAEYEIDKYKIEAGTIVNITDDYVEPSNGSDDGAAIPSDILSGLSYTDLVGSSISIGGFVVGETAEQMSLQDFAYKLLHPYQAPTISMYITPATGLYNVVSDTVSSVTMNATVTKKSNIITSVKFYVNDTLVNEVIDASEGGSFSYTYTPAIPINSNTTFKAVVSDGTSSPQATKTITFVANSYYGTITDGVTIDEDSIKALTSTLKTTKGLTYSNITMNNSRIVYAYPASLGSLNGIKDGNNVDYFGSYTKDSITIDGIDYFVYKLTDPATASSAIKQIYS